MPTLLDSSNPQNIKQEPLGFKVSRGPLLQPIQPQVILIMMLTKHQNILLILCLIHSIKLVEDILKWKMIWHTDNHH